MKQNIPFFSVVISVFNKAEFISDTLNSVFTQTFRDYEIIIVNDGSTDNSLEIINSFENPKITIIDQKNYGAANSRNNGIKQSCAKYVALLDGDDIWKESYLDEIYHAISTFPEHHVFACAIAHKFGNRIEKVRYANFLKKTQSYNYFRASSKHSILSSSSIVFDKGILEKTGYFDETIISGQDTDLWIRIGLYFEVIFIPKVLVYYVFDKSSLSNTSFDLKLKPRYDNYRNEEKPNTELSRFLNKNRYSLAIMSKINSDKKAFNFYNSEIDKGQLNLKEKILLASPKPVLDLLIWTRKIRGKKLYYKSLD
ncbi:Glycosyl transferase family 2 [Flavobacteriaceae bacterium MAR_2010_188]|nr:Glycosyl transferase family 2 [Flavobacteriaceae bacterium MAR_2010_188]